MACPSRWGHGSRTCRQRTTTPSRPTPMATLPSTAAATRTPTTPATHSREFAAGLCNVRPGVGGPHQRSPDTSHIGPGRIAPDDNRVSPTAMHHPQPRTKPDTRWLLAVSALVVVTAMAYTLWWAAVVRHNSFYWVISGRCMGHGPGGTLGGLGWIGVHLQLEHRLGHAARFSRLAGTGGRAGITFEPLRGRSRHPRGTEAHGMAVHRALDHCLCHAPGVRGRRPRRVCWARPRGRDACWLWESALRCGLP